MAHDNLADSMTCLSLDFEQYYEYFISSTSSEASSPSRSSYCSDTSPVPSPTNSDVFQYTTLPATLDQSNSFDYNTGVTSPTYTWLEPVDSSTLPAYSEEPASATYMQARNTSYRSQPVQVFQIKSNEFCARLGHFDYPFDVNEKFGNFPDLTSSTKDIPVPALERSFPPPCNSPTQRRQGSGSGRNRKLPRAERLWEFILRLLLDPNYNPSYIEWVDRERGMFRLVNSRQIARMWGKRKNNLDMTYEKLSRAMRYYYHRKILQPVFGKKLVYKFGPNSTGWQLGP